MKLEVGCVIPFLSYFEINLFVNLSLEYEEVLHTNTFLVTFYLYKKIYTVCSYVLNKTVSNKIGIIVFYKECI